MRVMLYLRMSVIEHQCTAVTGVPGVLRDGACLQAKALHKAKASTFVSEVMGQF